MVPQTQEEREKQRNENHKQAANGEKDKQTERLTEITNRDNITEMKDTNKPEKNKDTEEKEVKEEKETPKNETKLRTPRHCKHCNFSSSSFIILVQHINNEHKQHAPIDSSQKIKNENVAESKAALSCKHCDFKCTTFCKLQKHAQEKHTNKVINAKVSKPEKMPETNNFLTACLAVNKDTNETVKDKENTIAVHTQIERVIDPSYKEKAINMPETNTTLTQIQVQNQADAKKVIKAGPTQVLIENKIIVKNEVYAPNSNTIENTRATQNNNKHQTMPVMHVKFSQIEKNQAGAFNGANNAQNGITFAHTMAPKKVMLQNKIIVQNEVYVPNPYTFEDTNQTHTQRVNNTNATQINNKSVKFSKIERNQADAFNEANAQNAIKTENIMAVNNVMTQSKIIVKNESNVPNPPKFVNTNQTLINNKPRNKPLPKNTNSTQINNKHQTMPVKYSNFEKNQADALTEANAIKAANIIAANKNPILNQIILQNQVNAFNEANAIKAANIIAANKVLIQNQIIFQNQADVFNEANAIKAANIIAANKVPIQNQIITKNQVSVQNTPRNENNIRIEINNKQQQTMPVGRSRVEKVECTKCDFFSSGRFRMSQMSQHFEQYHKDRSIEDRSKIKVISNHKCHGTDVVRRSCYE